MTPDISQLDEDYEPRDDSSLTVNGQLPGEGSGVEYWTKDDDGNLVPADGESISVDTTHIADSDIVLDKPVTADKLDEAQENLPNGGAIAIPEGTWNDRFAIWQDNITLTGYGWGSELRLPDGTNDPAQVLTITGDNAVVRNIHIKGNKSNQTPSAPDGETIKSWYWMADGIGIYADHCAIERVKITGTMSHAVIGWRETTDDSNGAANADAERDKRVGNTVENCLCVDTGMDGNERAAIDSYQNINFSARNNTVLGGTYTNSCVTVHEGDNPEVTGNYGENVNNGVSLHSGIVGGTATNNRFIGCRFNVINMHSNVSETTVAHNYGESEQTGIQYSVIGGNNVVKNNHLTVESGGFRGILLMDYSGSGHRFEDNVIFDLPSDVNAAVECLGSDTYENVKFDGNEFRNIEVPCFELQDLDGVEITDNELTEVTDSLLNIGSNVSNLEVWDNNPVIPMDLSADPMRVRENAKSWNDGTSGSVGPHIYDGTNWVGYGPASGSSI